MSGDWSSDTVRNGLWGLDAYINMLEILLREAREARAVFQRMVSPSTGAAGETQVGKAVGDAPADLPPTPGAGREVSPHGAQEMRIGEVPGGSSTGPSSEIDAGDSELFRMEEALRAAGVTRRTRTVDLLRVVASANGGIVLLGATAHLLIDMGLSRSKATNLSGYLIKQMQKTVEFDRVGESGSGVYRWKPFNGEEAQAGVAPGSGGPAGPTNGDVSEERVN